MNKKQIGLSILEILIAIALGLVIISGVVRLLSHAISNEKLLSAEAEIQETINYTNNRLAFVFKEALSSPCGSIEKMLATDKSPESEIKIATLKSSGTQKIPNVLIKPKLDTNINIKRKQLPMIMPSIAGSKKELKDGNGNAFSSKLGGIINGTEYVVVMEISEKVLIDSTEVGHLFGGKSIDGILSKTGQTEIPTTTIATGVGSKDIPFIITDCKQASIFMPNDKVKKNAIPIDDDLFFNSVGYRPFETIMSPIRFYAYYTALSDGVPQFTRVDLISGDRQSLVGGVSAITYEWGLGNPSGAKIQGYFTTEEILDKSVSLDTFRRNVIAVKATITAQSAYNPYTVGIKEGEGVEQLSRSATQYYTIRNKMERL